MPGIVVGVGEMAAPMSLDGIAGSVGPGDAGRIGALHHVIDVTLTIAAEGAVETPGRGNHINTLGDQIINSVPELHIGAEIDQVELGSRSDVVDDLGAGGAMGHAAAGYIATRDKRPGDDV